MVCGCERCGTLMIQEIKGEKSRCVCPQCGASCNICLGFEHPLSPTELAAMFQKEEQREKS